MGILFDAFAYVRTVSSCSKEDNDFKRVVAKLVRGMLATSTSYAREIYEEELYLYLAARHMAIDTCIGDKSYSIPSYEMDTATYVVDVLSKELRSMGPSIKNREIEEILRIAIININDKFGWMRPEWKAKLDNKDERI